jgi:hypothetical protein
MIGRLKVYAALIGLFITTLAATWFGGKMTGAANVKSKQKDDYIDTRKRMDEVDVGDDPAVLRDWLRGRAKR